MDRLRTPFFVVALAAVALVVLVELGSPLLLGNGPEPPGRGLPYLALVDVVALFTVLLMGAGLVVPDRVHGRLSGIVTVVAAIVLIIVALTLLVLAVAELITMITLLLAVPFGTLAYLIIWGSFPRGDAAVLLSLLMFLKLVFAGMLVLAQQRFLWNKGLVALVATSVVANIVVTFLHGLAPAPLASILDDVAGIVLAVVAIVWAVVLLVGALPGVVRALKVRTV